MNCKQARGLFSARIDGELGPAEMRSMEDHLGECRQGCRERWSEFEATVNLVHSLPPIDPDPNFVGQVLDRVRAWEAQEAGRGSLVPASRSRQLSWSERLQDWVRDRVESVTDSRLLQPVRLAGAVALGLAGGILIGQLGLLPGHSTASRTAARTTAEVAGDVGTRQGDSVADPTPSRPFKDLADVVPTVHEAKMAGDTLQVAPDDFGNDFYTGESAVPRSVSAPVPRGRVTVVDGQPRITF